MYPSGQLRVAEDKKRLVPMAKLTTVFATKMLAQRMNASSKRWQNLMRATTSSMLRGTPIMTTSRAMQAWAMVNAGWMPSKRLEQSDSVPFTRTLQLVSILTSDILIPSKKEVPVLRTQAWVCFFLNSAYFPLIQLLGTKHWDQVQAYSQCV